MQIFSTDPARPLTLRNNFASERGGAIDLHPDCNIQFDFARAIARLKHVASEDNVSPVGAAVNLSYDNYGVVGENAIGGELTFNQEAYPHSVAAACPFDAPCGYIRHNDAANTTGAILHLSENAWVDASRIAIQGNHGGWLAYLTGEESTRFGLNNSLIEGNTVQHTLLRDDQDRDFPSALVELHYLTITGNSIGATVCSRSTRTWRCRAASSISRARP